MIYDPHTRQPVSIIGRYRLHIARQGWYESALDERCFVRIRHQDGQECIIDRARLIADNGHVEVSLAAAEAPFLN